MRKREKDIKDKEIENLKEDKKFERDKKIELKRKE